MMPKHSHNSLFFTTQYFSDIYTFLVSHLFLPRARLAPLIQIIAKNLPKEFQNVAFPFLSFLEMSKEMVQTSLQ